MEYKTKLVQALWGLYQQWDEELAKAPMPYGMFYKIVRPLIPEWLAAIDEDENLQQKIKEFILKLAEAVSDDNRREIGKCILPPENGKTQL